ncbi:MAK10-like protein [Tanacetum coccineum]
MENENPIRTLGDYSKPSHEGYRNTIELPIGNNVVHLGSDTIRLLQNECSFHGLRSEDPHQHLKDFIKLVNSLDLDVANRERTCLRLFQFSLRDQASNWLERLPAGSISTWEDLITCFLAQFFPPGRTAKLLQFFYDHVNPATRRTIDQSAGGKLSDKNAKKSWALLENLALYDNESWNDLKDFAKSVKAISLPQDAPNTSDSRLVELENQVQRLMEAHLAPKQSVQRRLSSLGTQLGQQQDEVINKINILWKAVSEKFNNMPTHDAAENSMAHMNVESLNITRRKSFEARESRAHRNYSLSRASIEEQNRNPSSPKRVHFINYVETRSGGGEKEGLERERKLKKSCKEVCFSAENSAVFRARNSQQSVGGGPDGLSCVFGGDGEEDFVMREGVVVSSSSLDMFTKSYLGGMMVSLIFLEGLEEDAWVEAMEVEEK